MAEYQYTKDLEMWNKGNEYNSPTAQMTRLKQAGLNPNLVYGSGTVVGNSTATLPKYQAPRIEAPKDLGSNFMGVLSQYENIKQQSAQTDLIKQNLKNAQIQESILNNQATKGGTENQFLSDYLTNRNRNLGNQVDLTGQNVVFNQLTKYLHRDGEKWKADNDFYQSPVMNQYNSLTKLRNNQAALQQAEINLMEKGMTKNDSTIARMLIQSGLFQRAIDFINKKLPGAKLYK